MGECKFIQYRGARIKTSPLKIIRNGDKRKSGAPFGWEQCAGKMRLYNVDSTACLNGIHSYTDIYFGDDLGDGIESDSPVPIMS